MSGILINNNNSLRENLWRHFIIAIPYIWLLLFFLAGSATILNLPLASFFCSIENWVTNWKKIFQRLEIEADDEYISYGHTVFHNTQKSLLAQHDFYKNLDWKDQDIIGKGNILGEFYYKKHAEHQVPIDMVKYRDTCDMLIKWIKELNNGNIYNQSTNLYRNRFQSSFSGHRQSQYVVL